MKVSIRSLSAFEPLKPADLSAYVQSTGWSLQNDRPGHSGTWTKKISTGETADLLVPYDRKYKDFVQRIADAVRLIAAIEERSELAVLDDITTSGMDIFRFQVETPDVTNGSVLAERGAEIYDSIPQLFMAGACSAEIQRISYGPKKSKDVKNFIHRLRFGQTEYGSYVIRVLSPVSPVVYETLTSSHEDPFERRAATSLMSALQALARSSQPTVAPKKFPAEEAAREGISANLCAALVKIAGADMRPQDTLNVRLTPARHRPLTTSAPTHVAFSGEVVPRIQEMGRYFKEIAPRDEESVQGYVIKLESRETGGAPHGPVVVSALIDGKQKKVTISLSEDEHQKAIRAYKDGLEVACRGTLVKVGQNWNLQDAGKLTLREEA